jgi:hypothetical protein
VTLPTRPWKPAAISLLATWVFFFEYLPPFRWVYIPWDMSGFHFPLLDYTFLSLKQGRFPLWDPSIYCGASYVGNIQAGLFYPPNWLLFAMNLGRQHVAYWTLEALAMAHLWLAFVLCFAWLRGRRLEPLACGFGALVFACGGPLLMQFTHLGMVCAYAWIPLGFWGVDQAAGEDRWQPLWKLVAASALCFLAGYPPSWFAFAVCVSVYALAARGHLRVALWTGAALAFSLVVCMVQLLPTWEAAALKVPEQKFGHLGDLRFFLRFFLPNLYDTRIGSPLLSEGSYLYLGVPAIFGLGWLLLHPRRRACLPPLAGLGFCLYVLTDPGWLLWDTVVKRSSLLADLVRGWNLLGVITLMTAALAAHGLDGFLKSPGAVPKRWLPPLAVGALAAWSGSEIWIWSGGGAQFAVGWKSALYPAVLLALFGLGLAVLRGSTDRRTCAWMAGALLLAVCADYKVFGTSRQFNADPGDYDAFMFGDRYRGLDDAVYAEMLEHPDYRVTGDVLNGDFTNRFRHYGLSTPLGSDPLQTAAYHTRLQAFVSREDARLFDLPPREDLMSLLGVRYYFTAENGLHSAALRANDAFQLMEPSTSYYKVYELKHARPVYRWEAKGPADSGRVQRDIWRPEQREFTVRSPSGGRLVLLEQFFPGWHVGIDGQKAPLERWDGAFQAVSVPPGEHRVSFRYRPWTLPAGAAVTLASLLVLAWLLRRSPP